MKKLFSSLLLWGMMIVNTLAQGKIPTTESDYVNNSVEMADAMRADGKIYVVVAVIVTLWVGLIVYLINTDQKLKKLEQLVNDK
ncbi:CcmD family protein [Flammeovirga agarivorans]|nr:CcmD family protein [Flammeovirga agarivorans]